MKTVMLVGLGLCISFLIKAQEINKEIDLGNNSKFLVGQINVDAFDQAPYSSWYRPNYDDCNVDKNSIEDFKDDLKTYHILVFLGTWCGDSKREVPRFMKILKTAGFPLENLKIVALDRRKEFYKKSPTGEEWGLHILRVPTFIFYENGKEVNRIIESPNDSLEKDIMAIVTNSDYVPHKAKSLHFD